jgi:hypothetical protein
MGIKQALTRVLMNRLPADDQARMVADFIAWLYADLPPAGEGRFGLPMLIYHHLLRLPPLRWLDRWVAPVEAPPEGQLAPLASRWL